jgi:uncharacterized membrane protein YagU involved in acid resistance
VRYRTVVLRICIRVYSVNGLVESIDVLKIGFGILIGLIFAVISSRITGVDLQLLIGGVVMALLVAGVVLYILGRLPSVS